MYTETLHLQIFLSLLLYSDLSNVWEIIKYDSSFPLLQYIKYGFILARKRSAKIKSKIFFLMRGKIIYSIFDLTLLLNRVELFNVHTIRPQSLNPNYIVSYYTIVWLHWQSFIKVLGQKTQITAAQIKMADLHHLYPSISVCIFHNLPWLRIQIQRFSQHFQRSGSDIDLDVI